MPGALQCFAAIRELTALEKWKAPTTSVSLPFTRALSNLHAEKMGALLVTTSVLPSDRRWRAAAHAAVRGTPSRSPVQLSEQTLYLRGDLRRRLSVGAAPFRTASLAYGASRRRTMRLAALRSREVAPHRSAGPRCAAVSPVFGHLFDLS